MTAFLFISSTMGAPVTQRVDLANIASLFCEPDEPAPEPGPARRAAFVTLLALLTAIGAIGDMVLVARPDRVAAAVATPQTIMGLDSPSARPGKKEFSTASAI